jgi:thiol-disulfide isomerase/thioredoxin
MLPKNISLLLILASLVLFAVSNGACSSRQSANSEATPVLRGPPSTTFPMPPLRAEPQLGWVLSDSRRATLADYKGKVLALDFYATWCAPCRESIPRLKVLQQRYGMEGLEVVGLNVGGPDDRVKVADFAKELGISYQLGFPDQALTDFFLSDDQTIPQTFVFGRDGQLVKRFIGYDGSAGNELEKIVGEAVSKQ